LSVPVVILLSQTAALLCGAALVLVFDPEPPSAKRIVYGLLTGIAGFVGLGAFYRGLKVGAMGVIAPIAATAVLVPVVVAIAHGERPSGLQAAGAAIAIAGVVAASLEPERESIHGRRLGAGVGWALVAAAAFGAAVLGLQSAAAGSAVWGSFTPRLTTVPIVLALVLARRTPVRTAIPHWPWLVGIGIADSTGVTLFNAASNRGLHSVVAILGSLYPVIVVALARLVLSERLARLQLAGAATALAGVALISAG
jgi:drug/metabolite transporter (DMT)-like permease